MELASVAALLGPVFGLSALVAFAVRGRFRGNLRAAAATVLGIFAGIGGASHGPGEMLQGTVAPGGILIEAWPGLEPLGGEPALTVVPSFLVTGALALVAGGAVTFWSATRVQEKKNGGAILILLSLAMLLVGGGLIPPIIGVAAGVVGTRIRRDGSAARLQAGSQSN